MAQHVPTHELKELMGHAKIDTTASYYLKVSESMPARVRRAFGDLDVRVDMGRFGPSPPLLQKR